MKEYCHNIYSFHIQSPHINYTINEEKLIKYFFQRLEILLVMNTYTPN